MLPCIKLRRVIMNVLHCLSHDAPLDMSFFFPRVLSLLLLQTLVRSIGSPVSMRFPEFVQ